MKHEVGARRISLLAIAPGSYKSSDKRQSSTYSWGRACSSSPQLPEIVLLSSAVAFCHPLPDIQCQAQVPVETDTDKDMEGAQLHKPGTQAYQMEPHLLHKHLAIWVVPGRTAEPVRGLLRLRWLQVRDLITMARQTETETFLAGRCLICTRSLRQVNRLKRRQELTLECRHPHPLSSALSALLSSQVKHCTWNTCERGIPSNGCARKDVSGCSRERQSSRDMNLTFTESAISRGSALFAMPLLPKPVTSMNISKRDIRTCRDHNEAHVCTVAQGILPE